MAEFSEIMEVMQLLIKSPLISLFVKLLSYNEKFKSNKNALNTLLQIFVNVICFYD